jgi:hypothetical protein
VLGDDKQAANAIQTGKPSEERAQRLGLDIQLAAMKALHGEIDPENMLSEARAWGILVEAQAGIRAFHAMADGQTAESSGLQGAENATTKAFEKALHGYRVAFPEEMANEGILKAIEIAATLCAKTFVDDLPDEDLDEEREAVEKSVYQDILEALTQAVWSVPADPSLLENDGMEAAARPALNAPRSGGEILLETLA